MELCNRCKTGVSVGYGGTLRCVMHQDSCHHKCSCDEDTLVSLCHKCNRIYLGDEHVCICDIVDQGPGPIGWSELDFLQYLDKEREAKLNRQSKWWNK